MSVRTAVLALFVLGACSEPSAPSAPSEPPDPGTETPAVISNGEFGSGLAGWTVTRWQNPGIATFPPETATDLGLETATTTLASALTAAATTVTVPSTSTFTGGTSILQIDSELMTYTGTTATTFTGVKRAQFGTTAAAHDSGAAVQAPLDTFDRTGATQSQVLSGLSSGPPFYPEFDTDTAVINESPIGYDHTANSLKQAYVTTNADIDPSDNKVHLRFVLTPALQDPGHTAVEQPYFFVELRDTTKGTVLFDDFNFSNQPGIPWKEDTSGTTPVAYTDWQIYDIAPGNAALAPGDTVEIEVYASGCSPGGHWGEVYVDGFGSVLPGLSIAKTGPQSANLDSDVTYNFTVKASPTYVSRNVVADDTLPRHTTFESINAPTATCTTPAVGSGGSVSCDFGTLNPADTRTFSLAVHENASAASGTATAATTSTLTDSTKSFATNQFRGYALYITGGEGVGQQVVVESNTGTQLTVTPNFTTMPDTTSTYAVLDQPDVTGTATAGAAATLTDSSKTWNVNQWEGWTVTTLAGTGSGQQRTIESNTADQLTASTNWTTRPDATTVYAISVPIGTLVNADYGVSSDTSSRLLGPKVKTTLTTGVTYTDLSISTTDGVPAVASGGSATYTITVTNAGPAAVTGASVTDTFPAGLGSITWSCAGAGGGSCATGAGAGNIAGALVTLPVGATATFTATATVTASSGTIANTATVATPSGVTDFDSTNNSSTDIDSVGTIFALTVTKDAANTGLGSVTSSPAAISCDTGCSAQSASFVSGTSVVLTAVARGGDTFVGWTGACSGTASTCTVTVTAATSVGVQFRGLDVDGSSSGNGTVICAPDPIAQGGTSTCTIAPNSGYIFESLTDNGSDVTSSVSEGSYVLTDVTIDHTVAGTFDAIPVITTSPSSTSIDSGSGFTYSAAATDADGPTPLVWSVASGDTCGGMINAATGSYSFTAGTSTGSCVLAVTVCDAAAIPACATQSTEITTNRAPTITSSATTTATEHVQYVYDATATDPDLPPQTLTWSVAPTDTCGGAIDPSSGHYTFTATDPVTTPCNVSVEVCDSGTPSQCTTQTTSVTVTLVNDPPVITSSAPPTATVNVPYVYGATATDPDLPPQTLTWSVGTGDTCGGTISVAGSYTFTPTVATTCAVSVEVCDNGSPVQCTSQQTTVTASECQLTEVSGSPQSTAVHAEFASPLVVSVKVPGGAALPGVAVAFTAPGSGASATVSGGTTDGSGAVSGDAVANGVSGMYTVSASATCSSASVSFALTNLPGAAASIAVAGGDNQSTTVATAYGSALAAIVRDADGNPISGVAVTYAPPASGASVDLSATVVLTDSSGLAQPTATADTIAGAFQVSASIAGDVSPASFSLTNLAGSAVSLQITAGGEQSAQVDTAFSDPLDVLALDAYDNAVPGVDVTFTPPVGSPTAVLTPSTPVTTGSDGHASVTAVADGSAGSYTVVASLPDEVQADFLLTNTPAPPLLLAVESGDGQTPTVGSAFASPLVVVLTQGGSAVEGALVTFAAPSTGPTAMLDATTVATDATGHAQVTAIAGTRAGAYSIGATTPGAATSASFGVTNLADAATQIAADLGSTPQTAEVNTAFAVPLIADVTDEYGNPVSGVVITFASPGSGASALLGSATATTDASGAASVTATATSIAGSYTVDATAPDVTGSAAFALTNSAGPPMFIAAISGTPQTATAGTEFATPLVAEVTDGSGNAVAGATVTFNVPGSGASATPEAPTATTDETGVAQTTVLATTVAGSYQVTATVTGVAAPALFDLANQPDVAAALAVDVLSTPQSAQVETPYADPLRVVVSDMYGNPVPGVTVTFQAPASEPTATLSATAPTTDGNGAASVIAVAGSAAGMFQVTATVTDVTPGTFALTNLTQPPSVIAVTSGGDQMTLATTVFASPLVAIVTDPYGNPVSDVAVALALPGSGASATASPSSLETDASGQVSATLTANATVGMFTANISATGVATPATAMFTVEPIPTTTALAVTPDAPTLADEVTLTATVTSSLGTPDGNAHVRVDATDVGSGALVAGVLTITVNATQIGSGSHSVVASYDGEDPFAASSSAATTLVIGGDSGSLDGGGGCAVTSSGSALIIALAIGLVFSRKRRRSGAGRTGALVLVLVIASRTDARAQTAQAGGAAVNLFRPGPPNSDWLSLDSLDFRGHLRVAVRAVLELAHDPLVDYNADGTTRSAVLSSQFFLHAGASLVAFDRYRLTVDVPIAIYQGSQPSEFDGASVDPVHAGGFGDISLAADARIAGTYGAPWELAAGVAVVLPSGSQASDLSDGSVGVYPHINGAGQIGIIAWAAEVGFAVRRGARIGDINFNDEVRYRAAVGPWLLHHRLLIGPELYGAADVGTSAGQARELSLEGDLGARYQIARAWAIHAGIGTGIEKSPGVPDVRAILAVDWASAPAKAPRVREAPRDRDGDGVIDDLDLCPDMPAGATPDPDRAGCPDPDRDGDGVRDHADACPDEAAGDHPDPHRPGCPDHDTDGDGVYDAVDQCVSEPAGPTPDPAKPGCPRDRDQDHIPDDADACPDQPGAPDPDPKKNGCPGLVVVNRDQIQILQQVQFATDKDVILASSNPILEAVANTLATIPAIKRVSIEGHTDNKGSAAHNQDLSERRAKSVMAWLVAHGIAADRLEAHGFGDTRAIAPNNTAAGRAKNRRVEFHIVDQGAASSGSP